MSDILDRAAVEPALLAVRAALLARAHSDAEAVVRAAEAEADATMAQARVEAHSMVEQARAEGEAQADAALADDRGRARRHARSLVLEAQRAAYDGLRDAARQAARSLLDDERWSQMHDALVAQVREALGPGASVEAVPDGAVGRSGAQVLELRLAALVDAELEALGPAVATVWSP